MRKRITTVTTATAAAIVSAALLAGCGSKTSQAVNAVPKEVTTTQAETQISSAASTTQAQETAEAESTEAESTEAESTEAESTEETSEQVSEEVAVADNTPEPEYEAPAKEPVYEEPVYEAPEEEPDNSVSEEPAYEEPAAEPEQPAESLPYLNEPMYTIISDDDDMLHVNVYTEDDLNHTEKHNGAGWQLVDQMEDILNSRGYAGVSSGGHLASEMPRYADVDNGTREVSRITSYGLKKK